MDQRACLWPDNMRAQQLICLLVRQQFYKALCLAGCPCAAIRHKGKNPFFILRAVLFQLFLGLAKLGNFRGGIDNAGDQIIIHMARLAGHDFHRSDPIFLSLVGQHRAGDHIANSKNARH